MREVKGEMVVNYVSYLDQGDGVGLGEGDEYGGCVLVYVLCVEVKGDDLGDEGVEEGGFEDFDDQVDGEGGELVVFLGGVVGVGGGCYVVCVVVIMFNRG